MAQPPYGDGEREHRPGAGVDPSGGPVVDPTKNVLDLVAAAIARQDDLRNAQDKLNDARSSAVADLQATKIEALSTIQNWMRDTEMKRISEKDAQRQFYETRIADMLRTSVESTSTLVSTQLVQIQNTFNERVAKLEQFRWESGGKTSVTDPAIADAMARQAASSERLMLAITDLQSRGLQSRETKTDTRSTIQSNVGVIGGAVGVIGLAAALIFGVLAANRGGGPAPTPTAIAVAPLSPSALK